MEFCQQRSRGLAWEYRYRRKFLRLSKVLGENTHCRFPPFAQPLLTGFGRTAKTDLGRRKLIDSSLGVQLVVLSMKDRTSPRLIWCLHFRLVLVGSVFDSGFSSLHALLFYGDLTI